MWMVCDAESLAMLIAGGFIGCIGIFVFSALSGRGVFLHPYAVLLVLFSAALTQHWAVFFGTIFFGVFALLVILGWLKFARSDRRGSNL